jgi:hypothetical protein
MKPTLKDIIIDPAAGTDTDHFVEGKIEGTEDSARLGAYT